MKRLTATLIALGLATSSTAAFAQSAYRYDRYDDGRGYAGQDDTYYDYARVVRVDPILDGGYRNTSSYSGGVRCYETTTAGRYERDGYYRNDGYYGGGYDSYGYGNGRRYGDQASRSMATIAGGVIGAVLGNQVGGGAGKFAATTVGSMVGGIAGREIYDQTQDNRYVRPATVRVCDPEPVGRYGDDRYGDYRTGNGGGYEVTYEYNGRRYTRQMDYHPGDRVRVRVDVSPE